MIDTERLTEDDWRALLAELSPDARYLLLQKLRHAHLGLWIGERRPEHAPSPLHLTALVDALTLAVTRGDQRIVVSMPPRHGKSETISSALAWAIERSPHRLNAYTTYNTNKANARSRKIRDLVSSGKVPLEWQSFAVSDWRTTLGGGLLAAGVGGGLTGDGVTGVLVMDDLLKNRKEAESPRRRDDVWGWFTDVAMTRLQPGASAVLVATRWHDDDPIGRIRRAMDADPEAEPWMVIDLPAVRAGESLSAEDRLPSDAGYALWPEMWSLARLKRLRRTVGEYTWAALFQQHPTPRGGAVFRDPRRYTTRPSTPAHIILALDPAGTESTRADHSALIALAIEYQNEPGEQFPLPVAYVLEVESVQLGTDDVASRAVSFQRRHGGAPMYIEHSRDGKSVRGAIERTREGRKLLLRGIVPLGDKFTRSQPVASAWNDGRVLVPMDAPWVVDFLHVVCSFTGANDARDDEVDALAHGWNAALRLPAPSPRPSTTRAPSDSSQGREGAFAPRQRPTSGHDRRNLFG